MLVERKKRITIMVILFFLCGLLYHKLDIEQTCQEHNLKLPVSFCVQLQSNPHCLKEDINKLDENVNLIIFLFLSLFEQMKGPSTLPMLQLMVKFPGLQLIKILKT